MPETRAHNRSETWRAGGAGSQISVEQVSKRFGPSAGGTWALHKVDFTVQAGEFVALIGESGCGKTTLLRLMSGLETPTIGQVRRAGKAVQGPAREVGFVFQRPVLLPWRTVLDNVLLPVELAGQSVSAARPRALQLLAMLGLQAFTGHRPPHLSGGMQQRVALARTLMLQPSILLMDEPFGALDAISREQLNLELLRMWQDGGQTVVFVTHDITEAVFLADRVLLMSRRPGTIAQTFAVSLPRPRTLEMRFSPPFAELCRAMHQAMGLIRQASEE
jgi:NitT/TauT family transport system ATP-binding protein